MKYRLDIMPVFLFLLTRTDIAQFPLEIYLALSGLDQSQKHLGQSGLAAARFAHDGDDFALVEIKVHMVDGYSFLAAKPKYLGETFPAQA